MDQHLLDYIEIKDFKCFKIFKAEGFKRVNLIGGKNNVGKTAFMEACYINLENNTSSALLSIIEARYITDLFSELLKEVGLKYILNLIRTKAIKFNGSKIISNMKSIQIDYQQDNVIYDKNKDSNIVYINSYRTAGLDSLYAKVLINKSEAQVDRELRLFDASIESFRIIESEPKCSLLNDDNWYNLNELGDGTYRYVTYLCLFYGLKDSIIFIDEIDNGIHYTQLDRLWEIILTISKEQNVQVFATTHSKECIESYARVSKQLEDEDISFIELGKNKKNELDSIVYSYNMIQSEIKQNHEIRGW